MKASGMNDAIFCFTEIGTIGIVAKIRKTLIVQITKRKKKLPPAKSNIRSNREETMSWTIVIAIDVTGMRRISSHIYSSYFITDQRDMTENMTNVWNTKTLY